MWIATRRHFPARIAAVALVAAVIAGQRAIASGWPGAAPIATSAAKWGLAGSAHQSSYFGAVVKFVLSEPAGGVFAFAADQPGAIVKTSVVSGALPETGCFVRIACELARAVLWEMNCPANQCDPRIFLWPTSFAFSGLADPAGCLLACG